MLDFSYILHNSEKNIDKMRKVCKPLFELFPVKYFYYQYHTDDGGFNCLGSHLDFMAEFHDQQMFNHIPFFKNYQWNHNSMFVVDSVGDEGYENYVSFLNKTSEKYRFKHAFSLIRRSEKICFEYGFALDNAASVNILLNNLSLLEKFLDHFDSHFAQKVEGIFERRLHLPQLLGERYQKKSLPSPHFHVDDIKKEKFLRDIFPEAHLLLQSLTKREKETLYFYFKGFSAREVGETLGLSTRTIENYLANIKCKLNCHTKSELFTYQSLI